ncbi:MAG: peptidase M64 [Muribaculaceae bacterium]|nr:peptidase M64 [Muribaculaceae bacterium]
MRFYKSAIFFSIIFVSYSSLAKDSVFRDNFKDSTLRIDYIFGGKRGNPQINLDGQEVTPGWAGRRTLLDEVPLEGNGQIMVLSLTGDTLYRNPFSSLFQEWLNTPEASQRAMSMESCFLVPEPKDSARIVLTLFDGYRKPMANHEYLFIPDDILIRKPDVSSPLNHHYIHRSGDPKNKIDVAILAEGYTYEEMDSFMIHASTAVQSILFHEPFKSRADDFNFVAVETPSKDSGVSVPRFGQWKDTAFSSHYSTFYSNRYLTTTSVKSIYDALRGIPFEHIIILANENEYGGGGIYNFYTLTTSKNKLFWPVVTHEFGHSFGGLADEYFYENDDMTDELVYPDGVEPWEGNITTMTDFSSKWTNRIKPDQTIPTPTGTKGVGIFEGGGYRTTGVYRPVDRDCRMRFNDAEAFCPVCQDVLLKVIDFYIEKD